MLELNFKPFPKIISSRLRLREISNEDVEEILYLRGTEKIMQYIGKPLCKNVDDALQHIKKITDGILNMTGIFWGITLKDDPKLIGVISLHNIDKEHHRAELGYILNDKHWRKGIINEAVSVVIEFGFESMGLHSIEAKIDPLNSGSRSLLLKHHFVKEAYFKENYYFEGKFVDTEIYSLLKNLQAPSST